MRQYYSLTEELFDVLNQTFASIDTSFRDAESRYGLRNALPSVSVPAVKSYSRNEDIRSYDDGDKVETYKNGKIHGEVSYHDQKTPSEFWIEGKQVDKKKWEDYCVDREENKKHVIYIDNKPYEVTGKQLKQIRGAIDSVLKMQ